MVTSGALAGCVADRDHSEGDRGAHKGPYGEHRERDRRGGYSDFRSEGQYGFETLDRRD